MPDSSNFPAVATEQKPSAVLLPDRNGRRAEPEHPLTPLQSTARERIAEMLARAEIRVNGDRPWDVRVHDPRFYPKVLVQGSIAAGESYMDGWWDVDALDDFFFRLHRADPYRHLGKWRTTLSRWRGRLFNLQLPTRAATVARRHYDLGNDLYQAMLDRRMLYTCAYWRNAHDLDEAQYNKVDLIGRKLHLQPGMTVLDLGSGFGGLAHFISSEYGCAVVSYNICRNQVAYARELCRGLPVRIEQKDYREAAQEREAFDRVIALGLCEHVGYKNYPVLLDLARSRLKDGGLFLLHTIGANRSETRTDEWIDRYIFPNGMVPSITQLGAAMESGWVVEDWHNFGPDYDRTLMAWWQNFERAWPELRAKYGDRFYRMWRYYLMSCAGSFRARKLQLWQIVLSKGDVPGYVPVR